MTTFSVSVTSEADVRADQDLVWRTLTDPDSLVRLTPLLTGIDTDGDTWVWHMATIRGLGKALTPVFTETMVFDRPRCIRFEHTPPRDANERVGAQGRYDITEAGDGRVHLKVSLTLDADLPLPTAAGPAVRQVMKRTASTMGDRFSANFRREVESGSS